MTNIKEVSQKIADELRAPLPEWAVEAHPTKPYLSTINQIAVIERMNEVFGIGKWFLRNKVLETVPPEKDSKMGAMIVVKSWLTVPEYGIALENYGGNDNADRGDAYKGACTDAFTKMGSYLGIGAEVWKSKGKGKAAPAAKAAGVAPSKPDDQKEWFAPENAKHGDVVNEIHAKTKLLGRELVKVLRGQFKISKANAAALEKWKPKAPAAPAPARKGNCPICDSPPDAACDKSAHDEHAKANPSKSA